jgi:hypothetical protein
MTLLHYLAPVEEEDSALYFIEVLINLNKQGSHHNLYAKQPG